MANNRLSQGVGKKIVEALRKQSEIEVNPIPREESVKEILAEDDFLDNLSNDSSINIEENNEIDSFIMDDAQFQPQFQSQFQSTEQPSIQPFTEHQQPTSSVADSFVNELDTFEIPSNIAALKKLVTQLPSGVTRQTGAQIIRQTMEALGISMKGVLQEAQEVQEGLSTSVKECQSSIQEYKKQIITLEKQCQNHQRQYSALNELISLFIQTGR